MGRINNANMDSNLKSTLLNGTAIFDAPGLRAIRQARCQQHH